MVSGEQQRDSAMHAHAWRRMAKRIEPNLFFNSLFSNKQTFHAASISDPYTLPPVKHIAS